MVATVVMLLVCLSSVVRADGPVDESSVAAMVRAMREEMREQTAKQEQKTAKQMAELKDEMTKKDEAIAALTKAKSEPKHLQLTQLTAGGEVVELVSAADVKSLLEKQADAHARRMDAQDAEIGKLREELKNGRAGAPPASLPSPPPPLSLQRPAATPARRLQSASNGDPVTELSLTGPIAAVSWNSRTPGLTSLNCTSVGDGKLRCSGELHVPDVFIAGGDAGLVSRLDEMTAVTRKLQEVATKYLLRNPLAVSSARDGVNGFDTLGNARRLATFVIGAGTFAIVASYNDDGVQLIDVSDPSTPVAVSSATDGVDGFDKLDGALSVATFVIGESTYAIVASYEDNGVQLVNVSDPSSPVAVGSATDGVNGFDKLNGAYDVATFVIGGSTFAIVTGLDANGMQLMDVSEPSNPVAVGNATDGVNGFDELGSPRGVTTFVVGASTYAIVTSYNDGVQIIDVSHPSSPVAVSNATGGVNDFDKLDGAVDVATFVIGESTYAIVASFIDNGVQLIDVSDPSTPVAVSSATDGVDGFDELNGATSVATFVIGESTYAIVAGEVDDGVQLINVSDPSSPFALGSAADGVNGFDKLDGAFDVAPFVIGTSTYVIVTGRFDNGVQLLQVGA